MFEQILTGIGAGITFALVGFAKSKGEPFDFNKFGSTIILGALIGIGYGVSRIPLDISMSYGTQIGAIAIIEDLIKALIRRMK